MRNENGAPSIIATPSVVCLALRGATEELDDVLRAEEKFFVN